MILVLSHIIIHIMRLNIFRLLYQISIRTTVEKVQGSILYNRHMKRQQKTSQIASRYLSRRHNLYKSCLELAPLAQSKCKQFSTDYYSILEDFEPLQQQNLCSQNSKSRIRQRELIKFCQLVSAENIDLSAIKNLIQSSIFVGNIYFQLLEILLLALDCQPVSKVSNIAYYLCKRSQTFRISFIKKLKVISQKKYKSYKQLVFLTDMFLFGIFLTQNEFFDNIIEQSFAVQQQTSNKLKTRPAFKSEYFYHYFTHYFDCIMHPELLSRKFRDKIISVIQKYIFRVTKQELGEWKKQQHEKLRNLRVSYTVLSQNSEILAQIGEKERQYLNVYHKVIDNSEKLKSLCDVMLGFNLDFIAEINIKLIQQLAQKGVYLNNCIDNTGDDQLLIQIKGACQNYKNRKFYWPEEVYQLNTSPMEYEPIIPTIQFPIPVLSNQYLQQLNNCDSNQNSERLAIIFLSGFNKNQNRQNIVWQIFKRMSQRNNLPYIIRVLAEIGRIQPQIKYFVNDKVLQIRNKHSTNTSNSKPFPPRYFKNYSSLIVQLCKFELYDALNYMEDLFKQIQNKQPVSNSQNTMNMISVSSNMSISSISNTVSLNRAAISVTEIIDVLSKMDRLIYYHSLETHIMFNQIIDLIYEGIRSSYIAYDLETISRFNALGIHLRQLPIRNTNQFIYDEIDVGIALQDIKHQKDAFTLAKRYSKILKQCRDKQRLKAEIESLISMIEKAITHHNFISSYYYADFIYKIKNKQVDQAVLSCTKDNILNKIKKQNYQGASNWARFFGELYSYQVIKQKDLIDFLDKQIFDSYFLQKKAASIKIICSALDTCKQYMLRTKSGKEMGESLNFLLKIKKQLLLRKGLKSTILQQQFADILDYFHPALTYLSTVEQIINFENSVMSLKQIQGQMNELIKQKDKQKEKEKLKEKEKFKQKQPLKYMEVETKKSEETSSTSNCSKDLTELTEFLQLEQLEKYTKAKRNQKISYKQSPNSNKVQIEQHLQIPEKPKKMTVISRNRGGTRKTTQVKIDRQE